MKKWIDKKILAGLFIITVFIIPLIVNGLFKIKAPFEILDAEWSADAALTYCGAIIAGIIAVYGVFVTIQYSQNNYREDVRNRVLPFIMIDILRIKAHIELIKKNPEKKSEEVEGYFEYKVKEHYCILKNGEVYYKNKLSDEQKNLLDNAGMKCVNNGINSMALIAVNFISIPIEIENIGSGVAVKLKYGFSKKDIDKDKNLLMAISLKPNEKIMLRIFSDDCGKDSDNFGEYVLYFCYDDILGNTYKQEFDFSIRYNTENNSVGYSMSMEKKQVLIGDKNDGEDENGNA